MRKVPICHPDRKHNARGLCMSCYANWLYANSEERREKCKAKVREWNLKNPGANLHRAIAWSKNNKNRSSEIKRLWEKNNQEKYKKIVKDYKKRSFLLRRANSTKRRAAKILRTPKWADLIKIKFIYLACPNGMHVDHVIPLQGKDVSGLHVETNLQYLTPLDNLKKHNKLQDYYSCAKP